MTPNKSQKGQVVALRLLLDLDTKRTAEVLGISPNTVMAHMAQATAALRHDLNLPTGDRATLTT